MAPTLQQPTKTWRPSILKVPEESDLADCQSTLGQLYQAITLRQLLVYLDDVGYPADAAMHFWNVDVDTLGKLTEMEKTWKHDSGSNKHNAIHSKCPEQCDYTVRYFLERFSFPCVCINK